MPDESLFSRFVRHLKQSGLCREQYFLRVFARSRLSVHPFLTIGVSALSLDCIESAETIFSEQTLGRLFAYYIPHHADEIKLALFGNNTSKVLRVCRIVNFSLQGGMIAKYCPLCSNEDVENYGFSYWHITHQIPGLNCCAKHAMQLLSLNLPDRPHIEGDFLPPVREFSITCNTQEVDFSRFVYEKFKSIQHQDKPYQHSQLLRELKQVGYITQSGRCKRQSLLRDIWELTNLFCASGKKMFPRNPEDFGYIRPLVSGDSNQHPFKYLLIEYLLSSKSSNSDSQSTYVNVCQSTCEDNIRQNCITLLNQSLSLAETSRLSGKSRTYLKLLAIQEGIPINLSPKILTREIKNKIIHIAKLGFHRRVIAKTINVSEGSIEQVISSVEGLVEHRKKCKFESKRRRYKTEILRALSSNSRVKKEYIKQNHYAAFHWLYRNEREWLNRTLPPPQKPKQNPRVDWQKRDKEVYKALQNILEITQENLSNFQLDKLVGGHGWLTRKLDKLPITKVLITSKRCK